MRINFPYPEIKSFDVPEGNLLGIFAPSTVRAEKSEEEIVEEAFSHPIGSPPLLEILEGCRNVLVVTDDYTRNTPVQKILPRLIKELEKGGIRPDGIQLLIASGTHRPMTEEEVLGKFGKEILKRFNFLTHRWWDPSQLIHLGETEGGTPIFVNRLIKEIDLIIGVGQIVPHRV